MNLIVLYINEVKEKQKEAVSNALNFAFETAPCFLISKQERTIELNSMKKDHSFLLSGL